MQSQVRKDSSALSLDLERTLDATIMGLASMDVEMLMLLAQTCAAHLGGEEALLPISGEMHARLSWKLLLLDRLLRQTRINLRILGLEPSGRKARAPSPADDYASVVRN